MQKIKTAKGTIKNLTAEVDGQKIFITIGQYGSVFVHYNNTYAPQVQCSPRGENGMIINADSKIEIEQNRLYDSSK